MHKYYVINASEDGDVSVSVLTKTELLKRLDERYWGDTEMTELEKVRDFAYHSGVYIIKGEQVFPEPRQIVETWDID